MIAFNNALARSLLMESTKQDIWYHGSGTHVPTEKLSNNKPLYMTKEKGEAAGFAQGGHLGGTKTGKTMIHHVINKPGHTENIDHHINDAMENGDDIGNTIEHHIKAHKKAGKTRYLEFTHPGFSGNDFTARVSLYPKDDLKIKGWSKK